MEACVKDEQEFFCVVIGAGMVGTAVAATLAEKGCGRIALVGAPTESAPRPENHGLGQAGPLSSHNDYTRLVQTVSLGAETDRTAERSIADYRQIEQETGVSFFHEVGYLHVTGGAESVQGLHQAEAFRQRWPFF